MADSLTYRFARPDEISDIVRLVAHSFPRPALPEEVRAAQLRDPIWGGGSDTLLVGFDRRPVAALQIHPLEQWVGGELLATAGIGTVTIAPTHRRRGLGAQLVTAALRAAHERGDIASALYPFRESFYHRLGYGQAGEALQYQVAPDWLPDSPERVHVECLDSPAARAEARDCYNRWAATQNGQLARSERVWNHVLDVPERALFGYRNDAGRLEGYALVSYRVDLPRRDRFLEVDELVWLTSAAARGLYGWLASLGDQWEQILVRTLPHHRLSTYLREVRLPHGSAPLWGLWAPAATLMFGPMFRLIDVRAALERRHVVPHEPMRIDIEVNDSQLPHNTGTMRIATADGRVHIDHTGAADMTIRLDIATLSRIYIGTLPPAAGYEAGLLECDRPELLPRLGAALELPEPWTFDRF